MDVRTALKLGIAQLRAANVGSHTLAAELLLLRATNRSRTSIYSHPEDELSAAESQTYFSLVERRAAGVPVQHLTGKQEFWGLEFEVTPDVLIPRPETEHVIEVALDRLALRDLRSKHPQNMSGEGLLIADIGTGSGCIAIALAKELPVAKFYALDISPAALEVAKRNAARLASTVPNLIDRISFLESSLLSAFPAGQSQQVDLIASNPPYIAHREAATLSREVRDYEPAVALFGGEEGYELYADLITQSAAHLKTGGLLVLELGHDSLPAVQPLFDAPAWTSVSITNDLAAIPRVIAAERTDKV
jgi:release factor glutamine methyltransferase